MFHCVSCLDFSRFQNMIQTRVRSLPFQSLHYQNVVNLEMEAGFHFQMDNILNSHCFGFHLQIFHFHFTNTSFQFVMVSFFISNFPNQTQQFFHRVCFNDTSGYGRRHPTSSHDHLQFQISRAAFDLVARASSYGRESFPRPQTKKGSLFVQQTRIYNFRFFIFNILPIQQFFSYGRVRSSGD